MLTYLLEVLQYVMDSSGKLRLHTLKFKEIRIKANFHLLQVRDLLCAPLQAVGNSGEKKRSL